ncbi:hypothetical protein [Pseudoduganella sp. OTU4001]|uniref:hypothetical protein n=1 Tax=Pseudoduganella sp. OTU4001 TaxID=3043854 RepID=UPI00313EC1F6
MNLKYILPALVAAALYPCSVQAEDDTQVYMMAGELNYVGGLSAEANEKLFALYDAQAKKPTVLAIRSPGGDTELGMALGRWVYQHKLDVKVLESCNSSCANYVFTAARNKIVSNFAIVGYHGGLSSASFDIDNESLDNLAKEFGGDREKARAAANELTRKAIAPQLEREVQFFETIGVQQRITTLGQADRYMKAAPDNAVAWYYGVEDFARLGVTNITVINPPWQPKMLAPGKTVFKVTVE